ncbi:MAG: DUF5610 domain-containing protein [Methylophagaceae bacterium]
MDIQFSQSVRELAKADDKKDKEPMGLEISELAHARNVAKKKFNASILESAINLSTADAPLSLVLKTALEGINEALQESMGDNAIQSAYDSDLDISAEATAERIVSLSTAFFGSYQQQHPELDTDEALTKFIDVIRGGIDTGFGEAREILGSLNVLDGTIATNIDLTYDLVQEGLKTFVERFNSNPENNSINPSPE